MFGKYLSLVLSLLFSMSGIAKEESVLPIQSWNTAAGTPVLFVSTQEIPMLDLTITFAAGSSRDGNKPGLASLTNAMLIEGANGLSADAIAAAFDSTGAIYSQGSGRDMAQLSLRTLTTPTLLKKSLNLFTQVLTQPDFPKSDFLREQKTTLRAIEKKQENPSQIADDAFNSALYGDQAYATPPLGTATSVAALTPTNLKVFYHQYYVAKNALITLVGNITRAQAETIANQLTAHLPLGKAAPQLPNMKNHTIPRTQYITFLASQTTTLTGQLVNIRRGEPAYFSFLIGNAILGGGNFTSRLYSEIREKRGLSYAPFSSFSPLASMGPFFIGFTSRSTVATTTLDVAQKTLDDFLVKGPSEAELNLAKRNKIGGFPLSLDSNAAISANLTFIGFYHLPLDFLDTFCDNITHVTVDKVKKVFQERIHPKQFITVSVGPNDTVSH